MIPLFLYFDDFEVCDPLSTAAGVHKIGALYYSVGLPPKFSSTMENVLLAQFFLTSDQKLFNNQRCYCKVIEELKYLSEKGIVINVNGESHQIYFVVMGILGDNLGTNNLLGFPECFVSEYYCRFCRASKYSAYTLELEKVELMRNVENYEQDLINNTHGVLRPCVFNDLPFFHNTLNWTCDLMHDFHLGVLRYDMAKIINHLIKQKYFTLDRVNERLKYFDFCDIDHGNKISSISKKHLDKEYISITAAQMSALVSYFAIIIGDLVPDDDPAWSLYLILVDILDIVTSAIITKDEVQYLRCLIKNHNDIYQQVFEEQLKSKHHLITHYPTCIEAMGPPRYYSSAKYESFHKNSKRYAHIVTSRTNIIYTLANKIQLQLAYRFYTKTGLKITVQFGNKTETKSVYLGKRKLKVDEFSFIQINRTIYKPQYAILLSNDNQNNPVFGIIINIIRFEKNVCTST